VPTLVICFLQVFFAIDLMLETNWVVQLGGHSLSRNNTPDKMSKASYHSC
jgi:hypothetical protein